MPTLQFMPWCRIDKTYPAGDVILSPFRRHEPMGELDDLTACRVRSILASYKDLEGQPIAEAALIWYKDRPLLADLSEDQVELTRECVGLACFSGLASRAYFNELGPYCNADCFVVYGQQFSGEPHFAGIISRRREGRTLDGRFLDKTVFSIPVHVANLRSISLDEQLLAALVAFRNDVSDHEWSRWQNAISCFNQANTDNDASRYQVEWVLLCGAFEHILEAKPNYEDVAQKLADAMVPRSPLLVRDAKRRSDRWTDENKPLRYEWMREFYRIRGDFSHGRLDTKQPAVWNALEHIVLATIAFPFLVRRLLSKSGKYVCSDEGLAQIETFEKLMDAEFLNLPADKKSRIDSVWSRLLRKERSELLNRKVLAKLEEEGLRSEEPK